MTKFDFKKFFQKHHKIIFVVSVVVIIIFTAAGIIFIRKYRAVAPTPKTQESVETTAPAPVPEAAKEQIAAKPPARKPSGNIKGSAKKNADGSTTVSVSAGGSDAGSASVAQAAGPSGGTPNALNCTDQTGKYPSLCDQLRSYANGTLKWGSEVPSLYSIVVKNAGETGWAGLYSGSYTIQPNGDITSAWGYISLNTYYYESSPYLVDYMKLVLSHEYGHHYTLYHKWVDWDLGMATRFPDSYYAIRPLSKSTTAYDYSLGWANCDAEIIAEDYSYLYSGYGYHGMSGTYGYPSAGTKTWLNNIASGSFAPTTPPATDNPPTVLIAEPANASTLTDSVSFSATANDDNGVSKVQFYVDATLVSEDASSPYVVALNTAAYSSGVHTLKAKAIDTVGQSAESTASVTFSNSADSEKPVVTITDPGDNPHVWASGDLDIKVIATDNTAVSKIELYIDNYLVATENAALIQRIWLWDNVGPGTYALKAKSYDSSNNTQETTLTINKS
jgi:hypothetical protein